jgi:DNA-binding NtrC family response regulator
MPRSQAIADSLTKLLDTSSRPIYAVDAQRRIVYCNPALATWIDLEPKRIVGRRVEFHSEEPKTDAAIRSESAPLTDLCPPPHALAGNAAAGTISCLARGGRMLHRTAEFVPLGRAEKSQKSRDSQADQQFGVLVLLASDDLSPQELAAEVSHEPTADELHRTIRRFRRGQAQRYSIQSLLGTSATMQKVRAQVEAAAASGANTLIHGHRGSGRSHVALAIHYRNPAGDDATLLPLDCEVLTEDLLERALDKLRPSRTAAVARPTLLLENLERMSAAHQSILLNAIRQSAIDARIIATIDKNTVPAEPEDDQPTDETGNADQRRESVQQTSTGVDPILINSISTISIRIPRLVDRLEDLPILAQFFLEACNRNSSKQVGGLRPDARDSLALYSWPGELDQLREAMEAAHAACKSHEIAAADLPPMLHHAFRAATHVRRQPERIVLDELLAKIEKEVIERALAQAGGNKSEAATLLGMTRPRLYRRLVQLGLAGEESDAGETAEAPEFIEQDAAE